LLLFIIIDFHLNGFDAILGRLFIVFEFQTWYLGWVLKNNFEKVWILIIIGKKKNLFLLVAYSFFWVFIFFKHFVIELDFEILLNELIFCIKNTQSFQSIFSFWRPNFFYWYFNFFYYFWRYHFYIIDRYFLHYIFLFTEIHFWTNVFWRNFSCG